ncbi:ENDD1 protein, partial [Urocolius indicus]|nr:ENDD1 protein [Urocolius indicus]
SFKSSCPEFFFEATPPNEALQPDSPVWICQRMGNNYHFATLYDKRKRIPVYSAYLYQPGHCKRPNTWLVEPQLVGRSYPKTMETEQTLMNDFGVTLDQLKESQAINQDYKNLKDLNRGHLNPCCHHNSDTSKRATFTLTNIVPQNDKLNGGEWKKYEEETMKSKSQGCTTTYVVVGAVPGNNYIADGRVNKPSHIWSSACCEVNTNQRKSWAVIAENDKNKVQLLTLGKLEDRLTQLYGKGKVSLFNNKCPR